jgi:hypothetical protein
MQAKRRAVKGRFVLPCSVCENIKVKVRRFNFMLCASPTLSDSSFQELQNDMRQLSAEARVVPSHVEYDDCSGPH